MRPGGTIVYSVCTLDPDECEAVVDASGLPVLPLGEEWPTFAHPSRPEFLLTLPHVHGTSGFFVARLDDRRMSWRDVDPHCRGRAVALRGRLRAPRRADRHLLRAECRIFHFDVGDGHFVEPITIGPVVLESIAPLVHKAGGILDCHLMVDNPLRHFPQIARAGGDSATFHYEVVDDVPGDDRRRPRARPPGRRRLQPESEPEDVAAVRRTPISFSA